MEIHPISAAGAPISPSSSTSSSTTNPAIHRSNPRPNPDPNPMQSWWESISKARSRIQSLSAILSSTSSSAAAAAAAALSPLVDSDRPARALLDSPDAYNALSSALSLPSSGSGDDPLCQWLYETYQSSDQDLRLVVLSFLPLLSGLYLSRVIAGASNSLAGFEAVLLSLYAAETKACAGKPLLISIPDLSQPSLYHTPRQNPGTRSSPAAVQPQPSVGVLCPPLEPQLAVKSTKRACIVAVALDCYYKKISLMPSCSKVDFCEFAASWAGQDCSCRNELDQDANLNHLSSSSSASSEIRVFSEDEDEVGNATEDMRKLGIEESPARACSTDDGAVEVTVSRGSRVPLPWELLQSVLKILGHCLLGPLNTQEVKDAASIALRSIYARASHDLIPQAILASRSLIQLDKSARSAGRAAAVAANSASNPNTPSKPRKPEVFLVSK